MTICTHSLTIIFSNLLICQDALVKEKKKDELRKTFANHANWFANWTAEEQLKISESTMGPDLTLNEQLHYLGDFIVTS